MRYRIDLSYNGSAFCGWQIQPGAPSVQGTLEVALRTLLKEDIPVTGAGRTDTGVHASMYVAHFDSTAGFDPKDLTYKLNAILPDGVAVSRISEAAPGFHARFDAKCREYTYFLHRAKNPFLDGTSYFYGYPSVDFEAMNRAASALLGTHDFSCFEKSGGDNKTSICTVSEAGWHPYTPLLSTPPALPAPVQPSATDSLNFSGDTPAPASEDYWYFRISADRFLRNMVRAIVGTLLEVGRGRRTEEDFASLVLAPSASDSPTTSCFDAGSSPSLKQAVHPEDGPKDIRPASRRSMAGESVPGHALFLSGIRY